MKIKMFDGKNAGEVESQVHRWLDVNSGIEIIETDVKLGVGVHHGGSMLIHTLYTIRYKPNVSK